MKKQAFIITSLLILLLGIAGNFRSHQLPALDLSSLPIDILSQYENKAIKIDDIPVSNKWEADFLVDQKSIGDSIKIQIESTLETLSVPLVKRYGAPDQYLLPLLLFLGITFWAIGCYVLRAQPQDWASRIFYAASMIAVITVQIVWPGCPKPGDWVGLFFVLLYWFCYALVPAFIVYFTLLYPTPKRVLLLHKKLPVLLFTPSFLFIIAMESTYVASIITRELSVYHYFYNIYNYGFRSYLIIYLILGIFHLVHSYFQATTKEHRQKVQWIIWGLAFGFSPFLFCWTLPQQFGFPAFIPEIGIYIFMTLLPISIALSIIKYQAMDINFVIEKSILYVLTALALLLIFLLLIALTDLDFREILNSYRLQFNLGIIFLALLLSPLLSQKIFKSIRNYFRGEYDFPKIIKTYETSLSAFHTSKQVARFYVENIYKLLPIKQIALLIQKQGSLLLADYSGFENNEKKLDKLTELDLNNFSDLPDNENHHAMSEPGIPQIYKNAVVKLFLFPACLVRKIWYFLFTQPLQTKIPAPLGKHFKKSENWILPVFISNELVGATVLEPKISGTEFSIEEIDLINQMAYETFKTLDRIKLQAAMALEQAEKEKLEELNQLKSEFISLVSHELRSPLTSIRWSVENLLDGIPEQPGPKTAEYLRGIHSSSKHLTRMIENLLDLSKIEAGKIEYLPEKLNLENQLDEAIDSLKPLAIEKVITVENKTADIWVNADKVLLREIFTNLLENAIKYSEPGKAIVIKSKVQLEMVSISVTDQGFGIAEDKLPFIFDKFSRIHHIPDSGKGLGLGLHIVKKMIELQGGSIAVSSEVGKGSTFIVSLPCGSNEKEQE